MKKHEIRKAVEKAARKHMPAVIDSVARSKAYDQVHQAMEPDADDAPKLAAAGAGDVVMLRGAPKAVMSPAAHAARVAAKR